MEESSEFPHVLLGKGVTVTTTARRYIGIFKSVCVLRDGTFLKVLDEGKTRFINIAHIESIEEYK